MHAVLAGLPVRPRITGADGMAILEQIRAKHERRAARDHGNHADRRREPARPLHLRLAEARRMTAVFADTFFWIALADLNDSAHRRALDFAIERENSVIVTTDEVLAEYLTYFATAHEWMRPDAP